jgi:hypothetical protein
MLLIQTRGLAVGKIIDHFKSGQTIISLLLIQFCHVVNDTYLYLHRPKGILRWIFHQSSCFFSFKLEGNFKDTLIANATNRNKESNTKNLPPDANPVQKFAGILKTFFSGKIFKPFLILTAIFFFQNWTGFIATIFYGVTIFQVIHDKILIFYLKLSCLELIFKCCKNAKFDFIFFIDPTGNRSFDKPLLCHDYPRSNSGTEKTLT